ncbi:MAG: tetratricopeptide repeat protein, partial [Ardenticatenaceae bacterium]|nr:tetratricopeptide repeat protein [Ardenticatenaceae bacterium]
AIDIEFNDRYSQASTYHQLGIVAQAQRQWETAVSHYQQALAIKIELNDRYSQASTYGQLGLLAEAQEQWAEAANHLLQALTIFAEFGDQHLTAQTVRNVARVWLASGDAGIAGRLAAVLGVSAAEAATLLSQAG